MGIVSKPYTFTAGATIVASEHNSNFDTLYNLANGNIDNDNISGTAAIGNAKLATITAAGKVSGSSFTGLSAIPAGAGVIPTANIGGVDLTTSVTGTLPTSNGGTGSNSNANSANGVVVLDASSKLPAVDGSQLTGISSGSLGSWASKSVDTSYLAATDLFVCAGGANSVTLQGLTDASNPPTTIRADATPASGYPGSLTMPVKKGNYWKITGSATSLYIYCISSGS